VEEHPRACRETGAFSSGHGEVSWEKERTLLGDTRLPRGDEAKLPGMGISEWAPLLVYQWDDLSGRGARELAQEDEDVPTMQGIHIYVGSS
jgi:hypothetical protein